MHITYDEEVDAAYISLSEAHEVNGTLSQVHSINLPNGPGEVILDVDSEGVLTGIEVLQARASLSPTMLRDASKPDPPQKF